MTHAPVPSAVPRKQIPIRNQTMSYLLPLANEGLEAARKNLALCLGLNTYQRHITHNGVAQAFGLEFVEPETALA